MRQLLTSFLLLCFTISGIACACPTDGSEPMQDLHAMHGADGAVAIDCCDDCDDEIGASHTAELPVVIDNRFFNPDFDDVAVLPVVIDIEWHDPPDIESSGSDASLFLPTSTPVRLHDRLLN